MTDPRVVVVGGGLGGLATAARLAAAGSPVTLLEQADRVGGKLGTVDLGGFRFDTGPSLVTMPAVFERLFAETGAPLHDVLDLRRLDVAARYRFGDGVELDLPGERAAIAPAMDAALGDGAGAQWEAFLRHAERVWDATHEHFLESPVSPGGLARLSLRVRDLLAVAPWRSLRGVGARHLRDPRLGLLLDRYATYSGSDPRRAPAALAVVPYVEQQFGSWYVPGGLRRLAQAVADRCRALGVTLRTGERVTSIDTAGGRVRGVRLGSGEGVPADVVVANADAATVYGPGGLLPHAPSARRLARTTPSSSGFVLLLGLDGRDPATPHHRVLFPPSRAAYDAEFDAYRGAEPPAAPAVYVHAPDDPALRPDDRLRGVVRAGHRPAPRPGRRRRLGRARARGAVRRARPGADGRAGRGRPAPHPPLRGAHAGRPRARDPLARRLDLRHLVRRRPRGVPAPGQPLAGRRALPRRRLRPPRRRPPPRHPVRRDHRAPRT